MLCTEQSLVKRAGGGLNVRPLRCKSWNCEHCKHRRRRDLFHKAVKGNPRILLTLTMAPTEGDTPQAQAQALVVHFRMMRQYLMRTLKRKSPTFLAVVEQHKSGWPHLHILIRSGFIHHKLIRDWWQTRTGSFIIDIKQVKGKRMVANYVSKYISKNPARYERVKRFWCSQDWDPPKQQDHHCHGNELEWWERSGVHPVALAGIAYRDGASVEWKGDLLIIRRWAPQFQAQWGLG